PQPEPESEPVPIEVHHEHKHKTKHVQHVQEKFEKKIAELEAQVAEKAKFAEELKDKWLRVTADFDNFRKRMNKEKTEWREFAQEEIIAELLPVLDNFDRALAAATASSSNGNANTFADGMKMVHKQLIDILSQYKVTVIDCVGKPFDPHFHDAVMTVPSAEFPEDSVVEEIQKGYLRNDKVIRPSMVKVSKHPHLSQAQNPNVK
ncbi:MAG: nucleotide exchange factor GrpE, partial [bacterium]|nr:nucleotide exchange factor GrpE [bacterium]